MRWEQQKTLPLIGELIDHKPFRMTDLAANTVSVPTSQIMTTTTNFPNECLAQLTSSN